MDGGLHPLAFQVCMTDREGGVNMVVTYEALFLALAVGTLVYTISRNQNNDENRKKSSHPTVQSCGNYFSEQFRG